ncbi:hypothetical protein M422DRAFT_274884 [Sphaerobolus stellatus SS14]|uniref:Uncharacterized protein n=1 Tax=Sphaerobolus stellatus (strain SS14) TaxID=990650 RepID=A0A0C9U5I7_SPHS4|nr:hypothetical protein M422DRAFT_274884 [Sphaerobolus stellatus SS14]
MVRFAICDLPDPTKLDPKPAAHVEWMGDGYVLAICNVLDMWLWPWSWKESSRFKSNRLYELLRMRNEWMMKTKWLSASIGYVVWGMFVEGYERESSPSRSPYEQARFQVLDEKKQVWQDVKWLHNTLSMKSKLDAPVGLEGWVGWL